MISRSQIKSRKVQAKNLLETTTPTTFTLSKGPITITVYFRLIHCKLRYKNAGAGHNYR